MQAIAVKSSKTESRYDRFRSYLPAFHCLLIGVVFTLATFRFLVTDVNDRHKCNAMLNNGQWLDGGLSTPNSLANWQPDGCMLRDYDSNTITSCLSGRTIVFSGDSIVRRIYYTTVQIMDPEFDIIALQNAPTHDDIDILLGDVRLQFHWDTYLNTSRTIAILERRDISQRNGSIPAIVIMGTGIHELSVYGTEKGATLYSEAIDRILQATGPHSNVFARSPIADEFILLPVEHTIQARLSHGRQPKMQNSFIDAFNSGLRQKLPPYTSSEISDISVLYAINRLVDTPAVLNHTRDGLHFDEAITRTQINLMLNLRCNDVLPKQFPFDATCCMRYPAPNWLQAVIIVLAFVWAPLGLHYYASKGRPFYSYFFPAQHVLVPMTIFGFSCIFMYFADRTSLFLKIQKRFDFWHFAIAMILALVVGLVSMKRSEEDLGFLNRDQTDEWKGWMQIVILIYHYYQASRVSGVYNPVRVLVAAYLFMSGYGHFFFYYKKADYGLARVASVLIRLNLLTLTLGYLQDTDYLSYYFSPLVTLWFGIIWATMWLGNQYNHKPPFVLGKIVVSAALTAAFHLTGKPLQLVFGVSNTIFNTEWNHEEWNFRVTLDMYIVYVGMLAALLFIKIQEEKIWERSWWPRLRTLSYVVSIIGLGGYFAFELRYNKFEYNQYHPYISFIPIISFVVLRNATPFLRSISSRAFIWIGKCSLETFICQFHLWLAGDTKGLLVLLPWPRLRFLNMICTTLVFLFVSNQIAVSTGQLTDWIIGKQPKKPASTIPSSSMSGGAQYLPLAAMTAVTTTVDESEKDIKPVPVSSRMVDLLGNLKFRCALLMGLIWIINLLYPSYHASRGHLLPTH